MTVQQCMPMEKIMDEFIPSDVKQKVFPDSLITDPTSYNHNSSKSCFKIV